LAASLKPVFEDQIIRQANARLWLILKVAGGVIALLLITICVLVLKPAPPPYVVAVNDKGEVVAIAHPVIGTGSLGEPVIRYALEEFIHDARTITGNVDEQKRYLDRIYALASGQAAKTLDDYLKPEDLDPILLGSKMWVDVHITRFLKEPAPNTYRIDWEEITHQNSSATVTTKHWSATLGIATTIPSSQKTTRNASADLNPLGLYVTTLSWAPEAAQ